MANGYSMLLVILCYWYLMLMVIFHIDRKWDDSNAKDDRTQRMVGCIDGSLSDSHQKMLHWLHIRSLPRWITAENTNIFYICTQVRE